MNALEAIEEMARRGVWVGLESGYLVTDDPAGAIDDTLADAIGANRDLIAAALIGRQTGHVLAPCSDCGELSMVARGNRPRCRMTPQCKGRHVPPNKPTKE